MWKGFFALKFPYNLYSQKLDFEHFFAPSKKTHGSLWPNLQNGEMIVRSCLLESKSTKRCFVREYTFQLQKANLSWLWDKWKVWKMTILFCVSHYHTLNSKSNVFIEFLFPRLLGSRHVSIKVLVFWFLWKTSQNWLLQVFRKVQKFCQNFWISDNAWILALKREFMRCLRLKNEKNIKKYSRYANDFFLGSKYKVEATFSHY